MISRRNLLGVRKRELILVDHNEVSQAVDNVDNAEILEIIDHHRLGTLQTMNPVFFRNQPVGCTATIIYQMYHEYGIDIPKEIAGLLCSAILSDTLVFRSPTCTAVDRAAAEELAQTAGIQIEPFAKAMFAAGSDLRSKTDDEIFYTDFKTFDTEEITIGIGQITSMSEEELHEIRERMKPFIEKAYEEKGLDLAFFMLTDIIEETTTMLCYGNKAEMIVKDAFDVPVEENVAVMKGVVSRKKQVVPGIMAALAREAEET
jgi:manganese-dependent inorganic pyrophosphatase